MSRTAQRRFACHARVGAGVKRLPQPAATSVPLARRASFRTATRSRAAAPASVVLAMLWPAVTPRRGQLAKVREAPADQTLAAGRAREVLHAHGMPMALRRCDRARVRCDERLRAAAAGDPKPGLDPRGGARRGVVAGELPARQRHCRGRACGRPCARRCPDPAAAGQPQCVFFFVALPSVISGR